MSSKSLYPWEIKNNFNFNSIIGQVFSFETNDSYVEKFLLNDLKNLFKDQPLSLYLGPELSLDLLECIAFETSLFGPQSFSVILQAENMKSDCKSFLKENKEKVLKTLVLFFRDGDNLLDDLNSLSVLTPRFWEGDKFLSYICDKMEFYPSKDLFQLILENASLISLDLVCTIERLKALGLENDLDGAKQEIIKKEIDRFKLASLFSQKKTMPFYKHLLEYKEDYEVLRSFFSFMQGHLLKMIDPSYMNRKARQSQYDKEILDSSKKWKKEHLKAALRYFSELEIKSKQLDPNLRQIIRANMLKFL